MVTERTLGGPAFGVAHGLRDREPADRTGPREHRRASAHTSRGSRL